MPTLSTTSVQQTLRVHLVTEPALSQDEQAKKVFSLVENYIQYTDKQVGGQHGYTPFSPRVWEGWKQILANQDLSGLLEKLGKMLADSSSLQGSVLERYASWAIPELQKWVMGQQRVPLYGGWLEEMISLDQVLEEVKGSPDPSKPVASMRQSPLWELAWDSQPWTYATDLDPSWNGCSTLKDLLQQMQPEAQDQLEKDHGSNNLWYRLIVRGDAEEFRARILAVRNAVLALGPETIELVDSRGRLHEGVMGLNDFFSSIKCKDPFASLCGVFNLEGYIQYEGPRRASQYLVPDGIPATEWHPTKQAKAVTSFANPSITIPNPPALNVPRRDLTPQEAALYGALSAKLTTGVSLEANVAAEDPVGEVKDVEVLGAAGEPTMEIIHQQDGSAMVIYRSKLLSVATVETMQRVASSAEVLASKTKVSDLKLGITG